RYVEELGRLRKSELAGAGCREPRFRRSLRACRTGGGAGPGLQRGDERRSGDVARARLLAPRGDGHLGSAARPAAAAERLEDDRAPAVPRTDLPAVLRPGEQPPVS